MVLQNDAFLSRYLNYVYGDFFHVYSIVLSEKSRIENCNDIVISTSLKYTEKSYEEICGNNSESLDFFAHPCIFMVFNIDQTFYNELITLRTSKI